MKKIGSLSGLLSGLASILMLILAGCGEPDGAAPVEATTAAWLNWRGDQQCGISLETELPDKVTLDGTDHLWSYALSGRGCPVARNGLIYAWGYKGEGANLHEYLVCLNSESGTELWTIPLNDYLSDIVYSRYSIGSPTIDGETGNVYWLSSAGMFSCVSADGKVLWQHSMMEEFGRLTFPNGRTGSPVVDGDLVIVTGITSNWGADGPARDRLYAFDKKSGKLVWSSTPGLTPKDNSFCTPVLAWFIDQRVIYYGTGCGHVACINARTGKPLWRFPLSAGGVNSSIVLYKNLAIAIHGDKNLDASSIGRMVAIKIDNPPPLGKDDVATMDKSFEAWRNDELSMFSSSPVLVGDRIFQMSDHGELFCINADSGKTLWKEKLDNAQTHASPLFADGKLYVPTENGLFYILKCTDAGATVLCKIQLGGNCLGAPLTYNGKLYVLTTEKLYCFGKAGNNPGAVIAAAIPATATPTPTMAHPVGAATMLQAVPSEILLQPGQTESFDLRALDANGNLVKKIDTATWESFIPPTAKVKATLDAAFGADGKLTAKADAKQSAGAFKASAEGLSGTIRGRIVPAPPYKQDFEGFNITEDNTFEPGVKFAYPPLPWIGARFKWEVRDLNGNKVLAKTLDNPLFQRSMTFIGQADMADYTMQADVMTAKNKRSMSVVGVINQRYIISLDGQRQVLEIVSNHERFKEDLPFEVKPDVWYTLKSRVDLAADGSGMIRAKAWIKGEPEPEKWTFEAKHVQANRNGSPGLYGFALQNMARVFIDNVTITPNAAGESK